MKAIHDFRGIWKVVQKGQAGGKGRAQVRRRTVRKRTVWSSP